jgi:hypothetical protein
VGRGGNGSLDGGRRTEVAFEKQWDFYTRTVSELLQCRFEKIALSHRFSSTVELHLSGLIGTASHPDTQKICIIRIFLESRIRWQFKVRLLLFTVGT